MSRDRSVRLNLLGDAASFVHSQADARVAAEKTQSAMSRFGERLGSVGEGFKRTGIGLTLASAFAVEYGKRAVEAYTKAEHSQLQLQNTFERMPALAHAQIGDFEELAKQIERHTTANRDDVESGIALLGTFHVTADQLKGLTPLVVDYARKFGIDIPSAAKAVGKAMDGNVGALLKQGVSLDKVQFATDRYSAVMQGLRIQVNGFATEEGATAAGRLEQLSVATLHVKEDVGQALLPIMLDFSRVMEDDILPAVEHVTSFMGKLPGPVRDTAVAALVLGGPLLLVAGKLATIASGVLKARDGFIAYRASKLAQLPADAALATAEEGLAAKATLAGTAEEALAAKTTLAGNAAESAGRPARSGSARWSARSASSPARPERRSGAGCS